MSLAGQMSPYIFSYSEANTRFFSDFTAFFDIRSTYGGFHHGKYHFRYAGLAFVCKIKHSGKCGFAEIRVAHFCIVLGVLCI